MEKERAVIVMTELVRVMAAAMADEPEAVRVSADTESTGRMSVDLNVAPGDVGKVIGKKGRTAHAMRLILGATSVKCQVPAYLNIVEADHDN